MIEFTALALLTAYLLVEASTPLRTSTTWRRAAGAGLAMGVMAYLFLGDWSAWAAFAVMLVVGIVSDRTRRWRATSGARWLIFHGMLLVLLWAASALWIGPLLDGGAPWWATVIPLPPAALLLLVAGLLVTVPLGGDFVSVTIRPYAAQLENDVQGLTRGGRIIGNTERLLIFVFVLANSPAAIGFLVAAKSIFRFGEVTGDEHRKQAEYVIIGTLVSFAYAVVTSFVVRMLLVELPW